MREELQNFKKIVLELLKKEKYNSKSKIKYTLKIILELYEVIENSEKELNKKEKMLKKTIEDVNYWKKMADKPDEKMLNANIRLLDKNNILERDIKMLEKNNKEIKKIIISRNLELTEDEEEILEEIGG